MAKFIEVTRSVNNSETEKVFVNFDHIFAYVSTDNWTRLLGLTPDGSISNIMVVRETVAEIRKRLRKD
jgi:hypothetical protein